MVVAFAAAACAFGTGCAQPTPAPSGAVLSATITEVVTNGEKRREIRVKSNESDRHDVRAYDPRLVVDGVTMTHYQYDAEDTELVFDCTQSDVADWPETVVLEWGAPHRPAVRTTSIRIRN
jgi:hypothetical protein